MSLNMNQKLIITLFNPHVSGETWYYTGTNSDGIWEASTDRDAALSFYTMNAAQNASKPLRKDVESRTLIEFEKITVRPRINHVF